MAVVLAINLRTEPPVVEESSALTCKPAWVNPDTFQAPVTARIDISEENQEEREPLLYQALGDAYVDSYIESLINWYCQENNINLEGQSYEILHDSLLTLINETEPVPVSKSINEEATEILVLVELKKENLQEKIRELLHSALNDIE